MRLEEPLPVVPVVGCVAGLAFEPELTLVGIAMTVGARARYAREVEAAMARRALGVAVCAQEPEAGGGVLESELVAKRRPGFGRVAVLARDEKITVRLTLLRAEGDRCRDDEGEDRKRTPPFPTPRPVLRCPCPCGHPQPGCPDRIFLDGGSAAGSRSDLRALANAKDNSSRKINKAFLSIGNCLDLSVTYVTNHEQVPISFEILTVCVCAAQATASSKKRTAVLHSHSRNVSLLASSDFNASARSGLPISCNS